MAFDDGKLFAAARGKLYWLQMNDVLHFVSAPLACQCNNCKTVPMFNCSYPCGHVYCRDCYETFLDENQECRRCLQKADNQMRHDKNLDQVICKLETYCSNRKKGCTKVVPLEDLLVHLKRCEKTDKEQLHLMMQPGLDNLCTIAPDGVLTRIHSSDSLVWEIDDFSKLRKTVKTSRQFPTRGYDSMLHLEGMFREGDTNLSLHFDDTAAADAIQPSTVRFRTTISILDQSDRKNRRDIVRVHENRFRKHCESSVLVFQSFDNCLLEQSMDHVYLKKDKIYVQVIVEPVKILMKRPSSHDGVLTWR